MRYHYFRVTWKKELHHKIIQIGRVTSFKVTRPIFNVVFTGHFDGATQFA